MHFNFRDSRAATDRSRRLPRAAALVSAALVALAACRSTPPPPLSRAVRLIEPQGTASTASLPRAQIGAESRYVLAAHPTVVLRANVAVSLPASGELGVATDLPATLRDSEQVRVDAWVTVRDPATPARTLVESREGRRLTFAAAPLVAAGGAGRAALAIALPEAVRGMPGLLNIVARPLSASPVDRMEAPEVEVPPGARLVFGYGVEEPGWAAGWPPVRVRVSASGSDGEPVVLFERRIDPAGDPRDRRWFDASVDLAPLARRRVRLVFEAEALAEGTGATADRSFAVVSSPRILPAPAPDSTPPNVVLVSLDTLRARSVSAYGAPRPTTPTLDRRLAAAGALVRQAVAPIPFTPPSHMTMLTGLEPCVHGVLGLHRALAPEHVTLAEVLRAAGYDTAAFTEDAYLIAGNGFERGFDAYGENRSEESASPGFAAETFAAARRWLAERAAEPFFLFVHTYQVHEPYTPPRSYRMLFADGDQADRNQSALRDYEREVRYTDDILADFLDALDAQGLAARTILVVTSDHGEGFGEHFWTGHGFDLHDEALLVPLVIRAPGRVPPGQVVEEQVGLADLAPTLLELAGLPAPPAIQGRSFARLLVGRGQPFAERALLTVVADEQSGRFGLEAVRTSDYKYIKSRGQELLYDLRSDPGETANRTSVDPERLAAARAALAAGEEACASWRAGGSPAVETPPAVGSQPGWLVNREQVEGKLRSLGYVQ